MEMEKLSKIDETKTGGNILRQTVKRISYSRIYLIYYVISNLKRNTNLVFSEGQIGEIQ
jgi:hypothetical protein